MSVELRLESVERSCSKVLLDLLPRLWTVHVTLWSQFLSSPGAIGKTIYDTVLMSFFLRKMMVVVVVNKIIALWSQVDQVLIAL